MKIFANFQVDLQHILELVDTKIWVEEPNLDTLPKLINKFKTDVKLSIMQTFRKNVYKGWVNLQIEKLNIFRAINFPHI